MNPLHATPAVKKRLTKPQREALKRYEIAEREEDRYLGSVFVTAHGQREVEARTKAAHDECKRLGLDHTTGL